MLPGSREGIHRTLKDLGDGDPGSFYKSRNAVETVEFFGPLLKFAGFFLKDDFRSEGLLLISFILPFRLMQFAASRIGHCSIFSR